MSLETYTIPSVIDEWNIILIGERINRGKILKEIATFIQRSLIWSKTKLLKKVWHVKGNDSYVWFGIVADEIVNEDDIFETLYRNKFLILRSASTEFGSIPLTSNSTRSTMKQVWTTRLLLLTLRRNQGMNLGKIRSVGQCRVNSLPRILMTMAAELTDTTRYYVTQTRIGPWATDRQLIVYPASLS